LTIIASIAVSPSPSPLVGSSWRTPVTVIALAPRSAVVTLPTAIGTSLWFGGQSDPGSAIAAAHAGALCLTVTLKVTEPVRPTLLVAEQDTVVVPIGKVAPELRGVQLTGSKPWCSLAQFVDHAVVTAHTETGGRAAFAVDLRAAGVTCDVPEWTSRGLREIPSGTVHFDRVPAVPLGGDGWYFQRPGFAWGGMGVAACWLGGAVALGRHFEAALLRGARSQREPDQVALAALGEVDRILTLTEGSARP